MTLWNVLLIYFVASIPSSLLIAHALNRLNSLERREQLRERGLIG